MALFEKLHVGILTVDSIVNRAGEPVGGETIDLDELTQTVQANLNIPVISAQVTSSLDIPALTADIQAELDIPALTTQVQSNLDLTAIATDVENNLNFSNFAAAATLTGAESMPLDQTGSKRSPLNTIAAFVNNAFNFSALSTAATLTGSEVVPLDQAGKKKSTLGTISNYVNNALNFTTFGVAGALTGTEVIPLDQTGKKRSTLAGVATYVNGALNYATHSEATDLLGTDIVPISRSGKLRTTITKIYEHVNATNGGAPKIDVAKVFGIIPNTTQNLRNQMEDAIGELSGIDQDGKGGQLLLDQGKYLFGGTTWIEFNKRFALVGAGARSSILAPFAGFSGDHFIQLGGNSAAGYGFDNYIRNVKVDMDGFDMIAVRGKYVQEGCGVFDSLIANCSNKGIVFDGGGNSNLIIDTVEVYKKLGSTATQGIFISTTGGKNILRNATVIGFTTAWAEACVKVESTQLDIDGLHMEGSVDGLLIAGNNALISAKNISGPFTGSNGITNLINVAGEMKSTLINLQKRSATNIYVNGFESTTLTDSAIGIIIPTKSSGSPSYHSNGIRFLAIGGNPEGAVDGEPGTIAHRKNAVKGSAAYLKESAKGTLTGWVSLTPLFNSKTFNWGSIESGAIATTTLAVSGAAIGDRGEARMSIVTGGIQFYVEITSTSTATIYAENKTASPIDLAEATLYVWVYS
ncbi:MAG: hypothetical protein V4629_03060 [Pseudomonadota bacterium]